MTDLRDNAFCRSQLQFGVDFSAFDSFVKCFPWKEFADHVPSIVLPQPFLDLGLRLGSHLLDLNLKNWIAGNVFVQKKNGLWPLFSGADRLVFERGFYHQLEECRLLAASAVILDVDVGKLCGEFDSDQEYCQRLQNGIRTFWYEARKMDLKLVIPAPLPRQETSLRKLKIFRRELGLPDVRFALYFTAEEVNSPEKIAAAAAAVQTLQFDLYSIHYRYTAARGIGEIEALFAELAQYGNRFYWYFTPECAISAEIPLALKVIHEYIVSIKEHRYIRNFSGYSRFTVNEKSNRDAEAALEDSMETK